MITQPSAPAGRFGRNRTLPRLNRLVCALVGTNQTGRSLTCQIPRISAYAEARRSGSCRGDRPRGEVATTRLHQGTPLGGQGESLEAKPLSTIRRRAADPAHCRKQLYVLGAENPASPAGSRFRVRMPELRWRECSASFGTSNAESQGNQEPVQHDPVSLQHDFDGLGTGGWILRIRAHRTHLSRCLGTLACPRTSETSSAFPAPPITSAAMSSAPTPSQHPPFAPRSLATCPGCHRSPRRSHSPTMSSFRLHDHREGRCC